MEELAQAGFTAKFGIDIKLLVAQAVNFLVIILVLSKFVYRPLLKIMRERTGKIEKGLQDAQKSAVELENFEKWRAEEKNRQLRTASERMKQVEKEAHERRDAVIEQVEKDAQLMHDLAKKEASEIKEDAVAEAEKEVGALVAEIAEKLLAKKMSEDEKEEYAELALREMADKAKGKV